MNSTILDLLTDPALRDTQQLGTTVAAQTSAGTPWLIEA